MVKKLLTQFIIGLFLASVFPAMCTRSEESKPKNIIWLREAGPHTIPSETYSYSQSDAKLSTGIDVNEIVLSIYPELQLKTTERMTYRVSNLYSDDTAESVLHVQIFILDSVATALNSHSLRFRETQIPAEPCYQSIGNLCHLLIRGCYFSRNNVVVEITLPDEDAKYDVYKIAKQIDEKIILSLSSKEEYEKAVGNDTESKNNPIIKNVIPGDEILFKVEDISSDRRLFTPENDEIIDEVGGLDYKDENNIVFYPFPNGVAEQGKTYEFDIKLVDEKGLTVRIPVKVIVE